MSTAEVGPCPCGGYGVRRCHVPLEEATAPRAMPDSPRLRRDGDAFVLDAKGSYVLLYDPLVDADPAKP